MTSTDEGTVKVRVTIEIHSTDDVDTGLTVDQWNALTVDERQALADEYWTTMAQEDQGGFLVLTDGAVDI